MPDKSGKTGFPASGSRFRVPSVVVKLAPVLIGLALFIAGISALYRILAPIHLHDVLAQARAMPTARLLAALAATFAGYVALIGYDWSALRYLGKKIPFRIVAIGGFLGYSFGNTVGVSAISGGAVRFRIYSAFGLSGFEVAAVSTFVSLAFGLGITVVGLTALAVHPYALSGLIALPPVQIRVLAGGTALLIVGVMNWLGATGKSLKIRKFEVPAPSPGILYGQLLFTLVDTAMAALTLYVLLPAGTPDFVTFLSIFAAAVMIGVLSHVPGGVGVFESVMIAMLPSTMPLDQTAAALLLYRMIYYLVPFGLAMVFIAINEARLAQGFFRRVFGDVSEQMRPVMATVSSVAPAVAGMASFGLGVWLLLMSLMPSVRPDQIAANDLLAAIVLEGGALISAVLGVIIILLAQGLYRRISGAFWLTLAALVAGAVASILNGLDIETALLLLVAVALLLPLRREFFRSAKVTQNILSPGWFALVLGIALSAAAFLLLMHQATPYSNDIWIRFASDQNAPRALRAGVLASAVMTFFLIYLALQPARAKASPPDAAALALAKQIIAAQDETEANLALTGDKSFLFSTSGDAFIMYAIQGKSWITYCDPVGPPDAARNLAWAFFDAAYAANSRPVFYEVSETYLPLWIEMGLTIHKIGEEAVVDLPNFSLAGGKFKKMRAAHNQAQRKGLSCEVMHPPHDPALMAELAAISDHWLASKNAREKRFSVGRFEPRYLEQGPIAVVRDGEQIIAFANLLLTGSGRKASIDLMRHEPQDAGGIMEYLFIETMEYFRDQGYKEFSLGIAPLSGLTAKPGTRVWNRFGVILFRHGGAFYNFEGLRAFKQKFAPAWRPRYLVVPGSLPPLAALKDVAILIAGGAKGLVSK